MAATQDENGVWHLDEVTVEGQTPEQIARDKRDAYQRGMDAAGGGMGMCYDDPDLQAEYDRGQREGQWSKAVEGGGYGEIRQSSQREFEEGKENMKKREEEEEWLREFLFHKEDPHTHEEIEVEPVLD